MKQHRKLKKSIQRLWERADRLLSQSRFDEASLVAQELVDLLRDAPHSNVPYDPDYPTALGMLAYTKLLCGFEDEADVLYAESISLSRQVGEGGGITLGRVMLSYGNSLMERGRPDEALAAFAEALEAMRATAERLEQPALDLIREIADFAVRLDDSRLAESALLSVIEPFEGCSDPPPLRMAAYYHSLSGIQLNAGRLTEAEQSVRTALSIAKKDGMKSQAIGFCALTHAEILFELGRYDEAFSEADKALSLAGHIAMVRYHGHGLQSSVHEHRCEPDRAISALGKAINGATEALGPYVPQTIRLYERLAESLTQLRRYDEALPHLDLLVAVAEANAGQESLAYANALGNYALALDQTGQYSEAQLFYRRALQIRSRQLGEKHPETVVLRFNLAELARIRGELALAERRFANLVELLTDGKAASPVLLARAWVGYGLTLSGVHKYDAAADKLERALAIYKETHGTDSPHYGRVLLAQGQLENLRSNHADAVRLLKKALAIVRDTPARAGTVEAVEIELATARLSLDRTEATMDAAEALLERITQRQGALHPNSGLYWRNLALTLIKIGAFQRARRALENAEHASRAELVEALRAQIESRVSETIEQLHGYQHLYLSLLMCVTERDNYGIKCAYEMLSSRGGAETMAQRLRSRRRFMDESSTLVEKMRQLKSKIVRLQLQLHYTDDRATVAADIRRYQEALEATESQLGTSVDKSRLNREIFGDHAEEIAQTVAEKVAVVEFTDYSRLAQGCENPYAGERYYAAFVIRGQEAGIDLVDIGRADRIDMLIDQFRDTVMDHHSTAWRKYGLELQQGIFGRLRPALEGIDRLIVVPAGRIGVLPLASLPIDEQRFLIDEFEFSYRFSSRRIKSVFFEEDLGKGAAPAVIGAPDYGICAENSNTDPLDDSDFLGQFRSGERFVPLPEAQSECEAIASLLGVEASVDAAATEAAILDLESPEMLHISTHGFFIQKTPDVGGGAEVNRSPILEIVPGRSSLANSLNRAGLALAGANTYLDDKNPPFEAGDGILYAYEIAGLDLTRTDLLTLSACQTGLGDVRHGDGVHGLQRAFTTAGARCIVCSLWKVPEIPTRKLFTRFYEEVLKERPRGEAFHAVVRELVDEYHDMPVAWGGFVLYGETDVLPRFNPGRQLKIVTMQMPGLEGSEDEKESSMGTPAQTVEQLIQDGYALIEADDADGAIAVFTKAAKIDDAPIELRARAIYERAGVLRAYGAYEQALSDYDRLERMPGVSERRRMMSSFDRGTTHMMANQFDKAVTAITNTINWSDLDNDSRAEALVNRAYCLVLLGEEAKALADMAKVIETPGMPPDQRAKALVNRSELHLNAGRATEAEADARTALKIEDAMVIDVVGANANLGRALAAQRRSDEAIESYDRALDVEGIPQQYVNIIQTLKESLQ